MRKNLLKELMEASNVSVPAARPDTKNVRRPVAGAVGAVSQGIADLRSRAVVDLDPNAILAGGLKDRLEHDEEDHALLMSQISEHGQQVPVLVRPHTAEDGVYQIVYGRRRVLACRDLGIPVKAMVRELDDSDLVVAQGQENTARRDLSFIEKANFARQMVEQGFKRKIICSALSVDKTEISRMLQIAERIPESTIHAIGPAPGIGRPRWQKLASLIEEAQITETEIGALADGETSDERFEMLFRAVTQPKSRSTVVEKRVENRGMPLTAAGTVIGHVDEETNGLTLMLRDQNGFGRWLVMALPELYSKWREHGENGALHSAAGPVGSESKA